MGEFDYYELRGVITPGAIAVAALAILYPGLKDVGGGTDFSLGELGVFIILSYVSGHILAAAGNLIEIPFWKLRGGWPSEWIGAERDRLLGAKQHDRLIAKLREEQGIENVRALTPKEWKGVNREMYSRAGVVEGGTRLVDVFNSNYGLFRGVTAALVLVATLIILAKGWTAWEWALLALALAAVSAYRMDHFSQLYSKELVARYLAARPMQLEGGR